jgi:hypothetical protein
MGLTFFVLVLTVFLGCYLKVPFLPISCDLEVIESDSVNALILLKSKALILCCFILDYPLQLGQVNLDLLVQPLLLMIHLQDPR